jgi:dTDP-4-dehydrorhamnose 3,5-epimerase
MTRFLIENTPIEGLKVIERNRRSDSRGFLTRLFCAEELAPAGWTRPIIQINYTLTRRVGAVRGLHFQMPPHAEMKLVSCIKGEVWDVAVDLRRGSPTFLKWIGMHLSAENGRAFLIPEGFAHGFQVLADDSELVYLHTFAYEPGSEGGIYPGDPRVGIRWPLPVADLSKRDQDHPALPPSFQGIEL